jgi:hypothetical protein
VSEVIVIVGYKLSHFPSSRSDVLTLCFTAVLNRSHVHYKKEIKFTNVRFNNFGLFIKDYKLWFNLENDSLKRIYGIIILFEL